MKVAYKRLHQVSIFGIKIFEWKTDYVEHSKEKDDDENILFIRIVDATIKDKEE